MLRNGSHVSLLEVIIKVLQWIFSPAEWNYGNLENSMSSNSDLALNSEKIRSMTKWRRHPPNYSSFAGARSKWPRSHWKAASRPGSVCHVCNFWQWNSFVYVFGRRLFITCSGLFAVKFTTNKCVRWNGITPRGIFPDTAHSPSHCLYKSFVTLHTIKMCIAKILTGSRDPRKWNHHHEKVSLR